MIHLRRGTRQFNGSSVVTNSAIISRRVNQNIRHLFVMEANLFDSFVVGGDGQFIFSQVPMILAYCVIQPNCVLRGVGIVCNRGKRMPRDSDCGLVATDAP